MSDILERPGFIEITRELIERADDGILLLMGQIIVVECWMRWPGIVCYKCYSMRFEKIPEGGETPGYSFIFERVNGVVEIKDVTKYQYNRHS